MFTLAVDVGANLTPERWVGVRWHAEWRRRRLWAGFGRWTCTLILTTMVVATFHKRIAAINTVGNRRCFDRGVTVYVAGCAAYMCPMPPGAQLARMRLIRMAVCALLAGWFSKNDGASCKSIILLYFSCRGMDD